MMFGIALSVFHRCRRSLVSCIEPDVFPCVSWHQVLTECTRQTLTNFHACQSRWAGSSLGKMVITMFWYFGANTFNSKPVTTCLNPQIFFLKRMFVTLNFLNAPDYLLLAFVHVVLFLFTGSVTEKPPGPSNSGRKGELRSAACLHEWECMKYVEKRRKIIKCLNIIIHFIWSEQQSLL